jgi:hypothetical protein
VVMADVSKNCQLNPASQRHIRRVANAAHTLHAIAVRLGL